jgi:hypothetical protein
MRLIINMVASYLSWFLCLVIVTIPKSSHSSRFWSSIYLLFVIAIHALFSFSEFSIISLSSQRIVPSTLTEFECVEYLQLCIPVVFLLFRLLSEWKYVDVETETIRYLATISQNHQVSLLLSFALPSRSDLSLPPLPPSHLSLPSSPSSSSTLFNKFHNKFLITKYLKTTLIPPLPSLPSLHLSLLTSRRWLIK